MNKDVRIQKISEILNTEATWKEKIVWKDNLVTMPVYEIPLEYLVYNKYNWRILSRTKSLETQWKVINPETIEWKRIIEKLLLESNSDRNRRTKNDIEKYWQKKVWIITRDWVIIDWNRRAMLLNTIDKYNYFRAIVLDVTSTQDLLEIEKLETSYQMWEDEKLDYNPIEVYLKTSELYLKLTSGKIYDENDKDEEAIKKIYDWIWDYKSDVWIKWVEFRLMVMNLMNEYLDEFWYNWFYTQLDDREEQFRWLTRWLKDYYWWWSVKAFDWYNNDDVDDLKILAFHHIRAKCKNTDFRLIAWWKTKNFHFFWNKEIWTTFTENHFKNITPILDKEDKINLDSDNLERTLWDRDRRFLEDIEEKVDENFREAETLLNYNKIKDEPIKLINDATRAINAINTNSKHFKTKDVWTQVEVLNSVVVDLLEKTWNLNILNQVKNLINTMNFDKIEDKEALLEELKYIQRKLYELEKSIKHS